MKNWAKIDARRYLSEKRRRKLQKKRLRMLEKHTARVRAGNYQRRRATLFGSSSVVAAMLSKHATTKLEMNQTSLRIVIPQGFSMLQNPEAVISLVTAFAKIHRDRAISDVFVDFSKMEIQDLGAHALLCKLVEEIALQAKFQGARIAWKGNYPKDPSKNHLIRSMGIIRKLGIASHYLPYADAQKIHLFERRCRHEIRALRPKADIKTDQANATERFANHVNNCLAKEGLTLTPTARSQLCTYVAEIIDNAENHAGMVDWTIQGYIDTGLEQPECEIVIFNFGKSIAETLEALPFNSYTKANQVTPYIDMHVKRALFSANWRRCDLMTLIALQGSVSSKNASIDSDRGQGTADLIEFFQNLNRARHLENRGAATMYIVSGNTKVVFDGTYEISNDGTGPRVIAFNKENDLNLPPDPKSVMPLRGTFFPGTMIGVKFPVQPSDMQPSEVSK